MSAPQKVVRPKYEERSDISPSLSESADYFSGHQAELRGKFGGKWVALSGRALRFSSDDLGSLQRQVDEHCPEDTLLIDYVPLPGEEPDWK